MNITVPIELILAIIIVICIAVYHGKSKAGKAGEMEHFFVEGLSIFISIISAALLVVSILVRFHIIH